MSLFDSLNAANFTLFAAKYYNNPQCTSTDEFKEDLLRFKYLKKLLTRYHNNNDLQIRLILNHIIVIYNIFEMDAATALLFHKVPSYNWPALVSILKFLNYMPKEMDLVSDEFIKAELEKI
jgi:hypothetical protein